MHKIALAVGVVGVGIYFGMLRKGNNIEPAVQLVKPRDDAMKVVVTGAAGQTGSELYRKLLASERFAPRGTVRSEASAQRLADSLQVPRAALDLRIVDVVTGGAALTDAMEGMDALVILTSAAPKLVFSSLPGVIFAKIFSAEKAKPSFYYVEGGEPKDVDWIGQRNQIDAAEAAGVGLVVQVGSMGGTRPDHFLNTMGDGNILLWKRKAEQHLIASGLPYVILHPGGLLPHPGQRATAAGGERQLRVGVDDSMLDDQDKTLPRKDLAQVCLASLVTPAAVNRSFDVVSNPPGVGPVWDGDLSSLLDTLQGQNCDYSTPNLDSLQ